MILQIRRSALFLLFCFLPLLLRAQDYTLRLQSGTFTPGANGVKTAAPAIAEIFHGKYYRLIQFYDLPDEAEKERLESLGVQLANYLPATTYTAILPASLDPALLGSNVRALFPIAPRLKLSAELARKQYPAHALKGGKIELFVVHQPGLRTAEVSAWLERDGVTVLHTLEEVQTHRVVVPVAAVEALAALPYVFFLEPVEAPPTPENLGGRTSHRSNTLMTDYGAGPKFDGSGVTVALNDDGFIGPHLDYSGRIAAQYVQIDYGNHGDHCAGIIFGAGNRNPIARGMAPGATMRVYKAGSGGPTGYQGFDSIYSHYQNLNVRITSTSYGNGLNAGYNTLARTMDQQITDLPQLMHVFSAGNSGYSASSYGAGTGWATITGGHKAAKNCIAVGNLDSLDVLNGSSSRGPVSDGRIKPEVTAVGTRVFSTVDVDDYDVMTGTSMACPGVSGTLAQLYQAWKTAHSGANPPSALVKAAVLNTADDLGNPGPDFKYGFGRINARRAHQLLEGQQFFSQSVSHGITRTHSVTVPAGIRELRVLLYWHDKPATAGATRALVNNLDLKVTTPAATVLYPWKLNTAPNATALNQNAFRGIDSLNNTEQVTLLAPAAGTYTISVAGTAVPMGPQPYYVVYELVNDDITLTYPMGGEGLVPGVPEVIRWDAFGGSGNFTLSYSVDSGASWTAIGGAGPSSRAYNWTPPAMPTGRALVRVTRGGNTATSKAVFSILGIPAHVRVDWKCADSMRVSYNAVPGAARYIVSILGAKYMDSVASSATPSCVVRGLTTVNPQWLAVQAVAANGVKGRRSVAQQTPAGIFNCVLRTDLVLQSLRTPAARIAQCNGNATPDSVRILVKNIGQTTLDTIRVGYDVNGGTASTAVLPRSLAPSDSLYFTFSRPVRFNNPGAYQVRAWVAHASDTVRSNDTARRSVAVSRLPAQPLPLAQNFETFSLCDTAAGCTSAVCMLSGGWQNEAAGDDDIDWRIWSGPSPNTSRGTGPQADFNPGNATGKYAYLAANGCYGKTAHLVSPCIDLTGAGAAKLQFAYHMKGARMGSLHVDLLVDSVWMLDVSPAISGNQGNSWKQATVALPAVAIGKVVRLRFRGITGAGAAGDIALDGISLSDPTGVSTTSETVAISVFPNPSASTFTVNLTGLTSASELTVTDMQGQVVERQRLMPQGGQVTTLVPLQGASAGVYFLSVRSSEGVVVRKLIRL